MEQGIIPNEKAKEVAYKVWCTNDIKSVLVIDLEKVQSYNNIPVNWCGTCKSLVIMNCETPLNEELKCYCGHCYSTTIVKGNIEDWLKLNKK